MRHREISAFSRKTNALLVISIGCIYLTFFHLLSACLLAGDFEQVATWAAGETAVVSEPAVPPVTFTEASCIYTSDEIDLEMRFHLAIAESLEGKYRKAVRVLGQLDTEDTAALYAAAMWNFESGDVEGGVAILEELASRSDAPKETSKYLAAGYLHLDRAVESEMAVDLYLSENAKDSYSHFLRGLAILRQNQPERAEHSLRNAGYDESQMTQIQQVAMQVPVDVAQRLGTITGTQAATGSLVDSRRIPDKNYNLTILFAGEFDSNVPLQPKFSGLGSNIDYEDYRFLMASFLDLQLLTSDVGNLGLVGSTYNTFQVDLNRFNIQDYMGGAYVNGLLFEKLVGSLRYEFHHTLVDESRFASEHRLTPSLSRLSTYGHTTMFYEFNPVDARAPALIAAQEQSAETHRFGVTQALYTFGGNGRVYAGYQYAETNADGSDFDRTSNMVTGRIERPFCDSWIADLDVRFVWDDYDNPNSLDFFGRPRDDDRLEVRTGLQKNFVRPVSLRLDYTYINNDSSDTENLFGVQFYDYARHIFSTQLIFTL
ncbi:hypothetical protein Rcae01_01903 [Novipirellula caenicola]|uniref:Tetratricopeptide repeat protein n=2 Tax=Novipirellula caenicola TaxID=1536901 RepID=A0ABP9VQ71_9BACT